MKKPNIILANDHHRNQAVISMTFEKDQTLISRVKTLPGARWSQSKKYWYIPAEQFNLSNVFETLQPVAYVDYSAIKDIVKNTDGRCDENNHADKSPQDSNPFNSQITIEFSVMK
jgi:hypothetical protein